MNRAAPIPESSDVVVIGAGVIGSAIALEMARRGSDVVVVDRLPAAGYGSTSASSAVVRFSYSTSAGVAMSYEGLHYWLDWPAHIGQVEGPLAEFRSAPMLILKTPGGHHEKVVPHLDRVGVAYEDLSAEESVKRFPNLNLGMFGPPARLGDLDDPFWGDSVREHDGVIVMSESGYINDPQLAAANLAAGAVNAGAQLCFGQTVTEITRNDNQVTGVTVTDGGGTTHHIDSPVVVNVGGPHSRELCQMAGVLDSMKRSSRPMRREVWVVPAPKDTDFEKVGFAIGDVDTGIYFRPESGNNILIGSVEPECDELEWVDNPDVYDEVLSGEEFELNAMRLARRVRGAQIPGTKRGLVSLYDASPDWTPIYDRTGLNGFYVAMGTSGNQFKNAAVAGHAMAELISQVEDGHDHDADPVQVVGRYTGQAIDMGTFTRNRMVAEGTSANVLG